MGSITRQLRKGDHTLAGFDAALDRAIGVAYAGTPASTLSHYTGARGLVGILKSRSLWGVDTACQDDESELRHADQVIAAVGARFAEDRQQSERERECFRHLTTRWGANSLPDLDAELFITCFCESSQNPELWDRFARTHRGYALEFKLMPKEKLVVPGLGLTWAPVTYDEAVAEQRLAKAFSGILAKWRQCAMAFPAQASEHVARRALWLAACYAATFTKSATHKNEREWRLASVPRKRGRVPAIEGPRRHIVIPLRPGGRHPLFTMHVGANAPKGAERRLRCVACHLGYSEFPIVRSTL